MKYRKTLHRESVGACILVGLAALLCFFLNITVDG